MRFPAVKIYEKGVERRDITYFMKVNNRTPTFVGDLRAQIGAAQLGARRLKEVIARHGVAAVRAASQYMIDYAARRFREEVATLARRRLRVGRLRRPRSEGQQGHPHPLQGDGEGRAT